MLLKRVLIVSKKFSDAGLDVLKNKVEVTILPYTDDHADSLVAIKRHIKGVDGVIWNTTHKLTGEILSLSGPQLKAISTVSSGVDHVDLEEVRSRGILLGNVPRVQDGTVADVAVGLLIATTARRFREGADEVLAGEWKVGVQWMLGQDISGSTVGIVGLGGIGQAVSRRLKAFEVDRILYTGRRDKPEAKALSAERVSLEQLLRESDFVILSCPLTEETRHLINADSLRVMKRTSVLINIARGGLIDHDALYEALKEQRIFAAGLDVTSPEPLPKHHKLLTLPNCYVLPHIGTATISTRSKMASIAARNIVAGLEGKPMECPVVQYN
ncbi:d-isomer specific 2-hydroxyacid dehydrogenase, NAD binding domain-containing protein [Phthorimaea operculella]|nr:d-isomer specific 2-hydroxyacid dehydrogenase, NAD binding domain-containing protein [Phthorimaea operculella]